MQLQNPRVSQNQGKKNILQRNQSWSQLFQHFQESMSRKKQFKEVPAVGGAVSNLPLQDCPCSNAPTAPWTLVPGADDILVFDLSCFPCTPT